MMEVTAENPEALEAPNASAPERNSIGTGSSSACRSSSSSSGSSSSSNSDSEQEEEVCTRTEDAMLGTLQRGLKTISSHAKAYMDTCTTDENRKSMQSRLETSMLGLLKSEQVVKELPQLVTRVVDDFVDNLDQEEENKEGADKAPVYCFKPMWPVNEMKMGEMSQEIFKIFDQKFKDFENTLTEDKLKTLPRFVALEEQVATSLKESNVDRTAIAVGAGDAYLADTLNQDIKYHDAEDLSDDELMLPNIDPLTKDPMMHPVRNKFCNHVFEEKAVADYIRNNPNPVCPLGYCRNKKPFERDHFVKVAKLTEQVRRKNMK